MSTQHSQYTDFQARRAELSEMLEQCQDAMEHIGMASWSNTVEDLRRRLGNERFKVLVLGEFSRGKSTFINALLGRDILPSFPTPCTAIINEVKYGEEPGAVLHFKETLPENFPESLDTSVAEHIERHRNGQVPPLTVSAYDLERFVVIPESEENERRGIVETPFDRAEITWPLDLLRDSVEIIDSPGLNESGTRAKITLDYLGKVDAILFLFSVHTLAGQSEMSIIDGDLSKSGHSDLFFVCNRFDELRRESDRSKVVNYAYEKLGNRTTFGREGIFFVSSLDAVIGREENKPALVEQSNIPRLEARLAQFLVQDRGRIKLLQPARQLNTALKVALHETIPQQRRMLECSQSELQQRYDAIRPELDDAINHKNSTVRQLEKAAARLKDAVTQATALHLRDVANQIPVWAAEAEVEQRINALKFFTIEDQVTAVATEVMEIVTARIEQEIARWQEESLQSILESQLAEFAEIAETRVEEFMESVRGIRLELSGIEDSDFLGEKRVGTLERILSGAAGWVVMSPGSAIEGVVGGYEGLLRSLLPQIALAFGAGIVMGLLHLNPVTFIPALLASLFGLGVFRSLKKGDALTDKVKNEVGAKMANMLASNSTQIASQMSNVLKDQTDSQIVTIGEHLDREIDSIRQQVESVLKAKEAGTEEVDRQLKVYNSIEATVQAINARLDEFIITLATWKPRAVPNDSQSQTTTGV